MQGNVSLAHLLKQIEGVVCISFFKMILNKKSVRIANPNCLNINNKTHTKLNRGKPHKYPLLWPLACSRWQCTYQPSCEDQTFRTFGLGQNQ